MMKRILSLLLCLVMVLSMVPVQTIAQETVTEPTEVVAETEAVELETKPTEEKTISTEEITAPTEDEPETIPETTSSDSEDCTEPVETESAQPEPAPAEAEVLIGSSGNVPVIEKDSSYDPADPEAETLLTENHNDPSCNYASAAGAPTTVPEKVKWIADQCRAEGITDPWEIAVWLHDWLIYNANYDYSFTYYYADGVLLMGKGVCQSYAEAYSLLLNEFSIENTILSSWEMDHAWNLVKLNGEWCHVDCTWDDPGTGGSEHHAYFGMDDALMARDHVWIRSAYPACTSKENYYYIRKGGNTVTDQESAKALFSSMAQAQTTYFECCYVGESGGFSLMNTFREWYDESSWQYGVMGYSAHGGQLFLRVSLNYGDPWNPPAEPVLGANCPNFTLRGPGGTYPMSNYRNGMVLVFGRETCGNTTSLLSNLTPALSEFAALGVPVFVNLDPAQTASDLVSIQNDFPGFIYTYYDSILMFYLMELVEDTSASITFPVVYVIDGDGVIQYYDTGYGQSVNTLKEKAEAMSTGAAIPDPQPVDPHYYGSTFLYTGNREALEDMIARELENRMPYLLVLDGAWDESLDYWESYELGTIVMDALSPYRDQTDKYTIPPYWSYYPAQRKVRVDITYAEQEEHVHEYVSVTTEPSCSEAGFTIYTCDCGDTYREEIPALGHNYVDGICTNCGEAKETIVEYTYGQNVQIKLIEPWGIRANAKISTSAGVVDYSSLYDYGVYFIRKSALDRAGLTQSTITVADIVNDADAQKQTKADGVTISSGYLSAIYDSDIYTYELDDSVFIMFYFITEEGADPIYVPVRERNLKDLAQQRMNDATNFPNDLERAVYQKMTKLETDVADYRSDFANLSAPEKQKAPTLAQYPLGTAVANSSCSYGQNAQIKLIEPWGLKANVKVSQSGSVIDYNAVEEYGIVALADNSRTYTDASEILQNENAYVFSSKNDDAVISSGYISATYSKDIFTYQLDTDIYVFGYVKDADGYHYGPVRNRNVHTLMETRMNDAVNFPNVKERTVYTDMIELFEAITAYREDYFKN